MKRIACMVAAALLAASAVNAETVRIGMVNDQSGPNKGAGAGLKAGVEALFKSVNEKGGVNGNRLELVSVDDRYMPERTVDGALKLIETDKVFALVGTLGTANALSVLPVLKEYRVPLVGPRSGAMALRAPVVRELFNIRAGHQAEMNLLVDTLARKGGAKR